MSLAKTEDFVPGDFVPPGLIRIFWKIKIRLAVNHLRDLKRHILVHIVVGVSVLLFLLLMGFVFFDWIFGFLLHRDQQPFGKPLMNRLVGMVLLAYFSMLTFSNLIIMLTTTYISREVEFYMGQPVGHRRLFFCKLGESIIYSSWAFTILALPFFVSLGRSAIPSAPWTFYVMTALMLIPYLLIPSGLGAIMALLITAFFPAKRTFRLAVALAGGSVLMAVAMGRYALFGSTIFKVRREEDDIGRIMGFMELGDLSWLPSSWLNRGMRAGLEDNLPEVLFWGSMLAATALMSMLICYWLAGPLYYRGYCASRTSGSTAKRRGGGLFPFFDRLVRPLRPGTRALVVKDMTIFWRDPAQWGQLVILFGLLFLYFANLGSASRMSRISINQPVWQSLLSLFNIGATCFILSILSTRFMYPMLSLEGKQQWVIGLAPFRRTHLVWTKYGLCCFSALALTMPLMVLSCTVLNTDFIITLLSLATTVVMALGLCSLAIGLGALMPNFEEDNPSRIANGLGGTINVVLSLIYIGLTLGLETPAVWVYVDRSLPDEALGRLILFASLPLWLILQLSVITIPMILGIRKWRRLEF